MRKQNFIILLILSIFLMHIIVGCGVMSNPKEDTKSDDLSIENSISDSSESMFREENIDVLKLSISDTNSEFISILGDEYKIFEDNRSLELFLNLIDESKNLLSKEDMQKIEIFVINLKAKYINFEEQNILFFPFNTQQDYTISTSIESQEEYENGKIFSIKLNGELNNNFYNILFYKIEKNIEINVKEKDEEITVLKKINTV